MKKLLAMGALMCVVATPAIAMPHNDPMHKGSKKHMDYFNKADTNRDGMVSRAENDRFADMMFDKADRNNDNVISRAEIDEHKMRYHDKTAMRDYDERYAPAAGYYYDRTDPPIDQREYSSGPAMLEDQMPINYSRYSYNYSPSPHVNY